MVTLERNPKIMNNVNLPAWATTLILLIRTTLVFLCFLKQTKQAKLIQKEWIISPVCLDLAVLLVAAWFLLLSMKVICKMTYLMWKKLLLAVTSELFQSQLKPNQRPSHNLNQIIPFSMIELDSFTVLCININ